MIAGARVTLVPLAADHRAWLVEMFALPATAEWWPGDNAARIDEMLAGEGEGHGFLITSAEQPIGFIQFYEETDPNYRHAMIDIVLHPDWCNRGYGTDALRALARHLVEERRHHHILIDPSAANGRAIASYRKVGFRDVGIMRRYELGNDGTWHDALLMDLLADELR